VGAKTNEIPLFTALLDRLDIAGAVITAGALHAQRSHVTYLARRSAHYLLIVKRNQPGLHACADSETASGAAVQMVRLTAPAAGPGELEPGSSARPVLLPRVLSVAGVTVAVAQMRGEVPRWPCIAPVRVSVRKHVLLDARAPAGAEKTIDPGPRGGWDAAGRDPPPPRGLRRADVEPGEHHNAGLRIQLAAVLQRHRRLGKPRDRQEPNIRGQFRRHADVATEFRRQRRRGFVHAAGPLEELSENNTRQLPLDPLLIQPHQVMARREDPGVCAERCHRRSPRPLRSRARLQASRRCTCGHAQSVTRTPDADTPAAIAISRWPGTRQAGQDGPPHRPLLPRQAGAFVLYRAITRC